MKTRIDRIYNQANQIEIDDSSRIIIMSECTKEHAFNQYLYEYALKKYYEKQFTHYELDESIILQYRKGDCECFLLKEGERFPPIVRHFSFFKDYFDKRFLAWVSSFSSLVITGYQEKQKLPKPGEERHIDTGVNNRYDEVRGMEIVNGRFQLIRWKINVDNNGVLSIVKEQLSQQQPLSTYKKKKKAGE